MVHVQLHGQLDHRDRVVPRGRSGHDNLGLLISNEDTQTLEPETALSNRSPLGFPTSGGFLDVVLPQTNPELLRRRSQCTTDVKGEGDTFSSAFFYVLFNCTLGLPLFIVSYTVIMIVPRPPPCYIASSSKIPCVQ